MLPVRLKRNGHWSPDAERPDQKPPNYTFQVTISFRVQVTFDPGQVKSFDDLLQVGWPRFATCREHSKNVLEFGSVPEFGWASDAGEVKDRHRSDQSRGHVLVQRFFAVLLRDNNRERVIFTSEIAIRFLSREFCCELSFVAAPCDCLVVFELVVMLACGLANQKIINVAASLFLDPDRDPVIDHARCEFEQPGNGERIFVPIPFSVVAAADLAIQLAHSRDPTWPPQLLPCVR